MNAHKTHTTNSNRICGSFLLRTNLIGSQLDKIFCMNWGGNCDEAGYHLWIAKIVRQWNTMYRYKKITVRNASPRVALTRRWNRIVLRKDFDCRLLSCVYAVRYAYTCMCVERWIMRYIMHENTLNKNDNNNRIKTLHIKFTNQWGATEYKHPRLKKSQTKNIGFLRKKCAERWYFVVSELNNDLLVFVRFWIYSIPISCFQSRFLFSQRNQIKTFEDKKKHDRYFDLIN